MIEVVLNDRLGKKVRVKCNEDDTIGDLKKLVAAQTGTRPEKIRIQKWTTSPSRTTRSTTAWASSSTTTRPGRALPPGLFAETFDIAIRHIKIALQEIEDYKKAKALSAEIESQTEHETSCNEGDATDTYGEPCGNKFGAAGSSAGLRDTASKHEASGH
ncbi:hypothetical protein EJB05_02219, partial [Eragrostis curvula]